MFSLNPNAGTPIYRQLIDQVRRLVAGGQLKPGDELPSVRELALAHAVNPMTISKAYSLMEAEGLLTRQRGKPMTIAAQVRVQESLDQRLSHLQPLLEQLVEAAGQLQINDDALHQALDRVLEQRTAMEGQRS